MNLSNGEPAPSRNLAPDLLMHNINDSFFDGYYKEVWRTVIPEELTVKEVDFMVSHFHLGPSTRVLDLMCGYGRHAVSLGRKGIPVTAVDNLADYVGEIWDTVSKETLPVTPVKQNVLDYLTTDRFDLAICMGNSLNFFNAQETLQLLFNVSSFLKPGGHLLINSWSIAEIAIRNFKEKSWSSVGTMKFLVDSKFLFQPNRIETESTIITADGATEVKRGIDYIFSLNELGSMLKAAGFSLDEIFSIPGKKKFTIGEPRVYLVARKT